MRRSLVVMALVSVISMLVLLFSYTKCSDGELRQEDRNNRLIFEIRPDEDPSDVVYVYSG